MQSVFSVMADRWNIDPEVSLRIAAGFGGGLAWSARNCGCVAGATMASYVAYGAISPDMNRSEKEKTYEACQRLMHAFEKRNGSTLCAELLGCDIRSLGGLAKARRQGLFQTRCIRLVRDVADIVQDVLAGA